VGTGPYRFQEWVSGQRIVLKANDDYFEGRPHVDQYIYRIIPDTSTMFLELKAGGLDYMGLTPLLFQKQTDTPLFRKNFNKFRYPAFAYTYMGYNLQDPKFQDRRVRQAIAHAVDKKSIIQGVLLGLGRPATGPFPPESWAYDTTVRDYPYDPEKAKSLLKEAGWSDSNGDDVLDKNGVPFRFTLLTNQGNEERAKNAEIIQQNLSKIGIRVDIKILEWQALLHEFIDKRKFDAIILGWSLGRDPDAYDIFHSSKTKEGEFNFVSYKNPRVDELLLEGRKTCNQEKRTEIYHEIHRLIAEDQPYTFLYYPEALPVIHKRFQGIEPSPIGIWYNFKDWQVPKDWEGFLK
jgi:peptide/nickel transport system substrate-binding protein